MYILKNNFKSIVVETTRFNDIIIVLIENDENAIKVDKINDQENQKKKDQIHV